MREFLLGTAILLGTAPVAHALIWEYPTLELGPETAAVYCEINDVRFLAESRESCEQAGGRATHKIVRDVEEHSSSE